MLHCFSHSLSLSLWPTSLWRSSEPIRDAIKAFVCGCLGCMHIRLAATKGHWLQPTQPLVPLTWSAANRRRYFHARASGRQSFFVIFLKKCIYFFVIFECFICEKELEECIHDFSLQLNSNMLQKRGGLQKFAFRIDSRLLQVDPQTLHYPLFFCLLVARNMNG